MSDLRNRYAAHRLACIEAVAEIAKHDLPLARSAARVLGIAMPAPDTSVFFAELLREQEKQTSRRKTLAWLAVSIALAAFLAWFAAPDLAAWSNGQPPIPGGQNE